MHIQRCYLIMFGYRLSPQCFSSRYYYFSIYVYGICKVSILVTFILFADYTNNFFTDDILNKMQDVLGAELTTRWFKVNK